VEIEPAEYGLRGARIRLVDALELDHHPAGAGRRREAEADPLVLPAHLDPLHALEHLLLALDLSRLRVLGAETLDEALELGDALHLVLLRGEERRPPPLALDREERVVPGVALEPAAGQLVDLARGAIEEGAIVRDDDDRA